MKYVHYPKSQAELGSREDGEEAPGMSQKMGAVQGVPYPPNRPGVLTEKP